MARTVAAIVHRCTAMQHTVAGGRNDKLCFPRGMAMGRFPGTGFFLIAGLIACAPGYAQTMYRCGNKYQDRPCDAGQKSKAVGSASFGAAEASSGDAQCAQRGKDALKIVWSREGGAPQE